MIRFYGNNRRLVWLLVAVLVFVAASAVLVVSENEGIDRLASGIITVAGTTALAVLTGIRIGKLEASAIGFIEDILQDLRTRPVGDVLSDADKRALDRLRTDAGATTVEFADEVIRRYLDRINRPR